MPTKNRTHLRTREQNKYKNKYVPTTPAKPLSFQEVRESQYRLKIMGLLWFSGDLPIDPDEQITFQLCPNPDFERQFGDFTDGWTEEQLAAFCRTMPTPVWWKGGRR